MRMGHGLVIDTLLLHGADVNLRVSDGSGRDGTPLMCAALYGHPAVYGAAAVVPIW